MENAMNDELHNYYNLLGLSPGASSEELKTAHRDLAKVWHPDRFPHDPRLQEKAQEKLKEINRAYDRLRSGNARRQTEPSTRERHAPPTPSHYDQDAQTNTQTVSVRMAQRIGWQLIVAPVLIFAVAFLVTSRSLPRPGGREDQSQEPAIEQDQDPPNPGSQQPGRRVNTSGNELPPGKDAIEVKSHRLESGGASTSQPSAAPLRPLPTVTTVIDPTTGMIARPDCPMKTRMTYPSGTEPHQYIASHSAAPTAPGGASGPKESSLKSVAKRLASPGKWFRKQ